MARPYTRPPYPMVKVTMWIGRDDWAWLQARCPNDCSRMIRELLIEYRRGAEAREAPCEAALDLEQL